MFKNCDCFGVKSKEKNANGACAKEQILSFMFYYTILVIPNNIDSFIKISGAGLFVTTVVVGTISFMPAFTLTKRPFTRDVLFYLGAVAWAAITLHNQRISLYESIGK